MKVHLLSTDENIEGKGDIAVRELSSSRHNVCKTACWSRVIQVHVGKGLEA